MLKINLLPESKQLQRKIQKANIMSTTVAVVIVGLTIFVALAMLVVNTTKNQRAEKLEKNIKKTENELQDYKKLEETVISLEQGLVRIESILKGGSKWSLFFKELEKSTPNDIRYLSLDVKDTAVKAQLEGANVNSLARYVESIKGYKVKKDDVEQNLYSNMVVKEFTKEGDKVKFSAEFTINKGVLW